MSLQILIGWDSRAAIAYDVAHFSLHRRTDTALTIYPLKLESLRATGLLTRPVERRDGNLWCPISQAPMATEFAISRFAVPFLQKTGWALFADCDIICYADIADLFALADDRFAVMCVKHPDGMDGFRTDNGLKMDGQIQTFYKRKNWSSVVLWNCGHQSNRKLTHEVLNTWPGRDLHAFKWLTDDEIGELPAEWNHLVDIHSDRVLPKIAHLTLGGPWFKDWLVGSGSYDKLWLEEMEAMDRKLIPA